MWKDPIVEEVRKARQEHAARFGYDLRAIYNDLKNSEKLGGRKVVSLSTKKPKKDETTTKKRQQPA
jgi:hypothetical protein